MNIRAWGTAFRDAFRSMTQSSLMSLASMGTVTVSLLVLSVVLLLAVNLQNAASSLEQQVEIKAYVCAAWDETTKCNKQEPKDEQKKALGEQLKRLPGVAKVTYMTRQQALERMKQEFGEQKDLLEGLDENPLSDVFEVTTTDPAYVKGIAEAAAKLAGIRKVDYGQEWVDKLTTFTHAVRIGGVGLVILLVIATVLTISNTIRLAVYARRREIGIMKLVGATDWYIRRPFMIEGVFLGMVGSLLSMVITGSGYQRLAGYMHQNIPFLPVVPPQDVLMSLTLGLILLGAVLGAVGSLISMRRFLKV